MFNLKDYSSVQIVQANIRGELQTYARLKKSYEYSSLYRLCWPTTQVAMMNQERFLEDAIKLEESISSRLLVATLDSSYVPVLGSDGWMKEQEPWEGYFERTGEILPPFKTKAGKVSLSGNTIYIPQKAVNYIPELEEAYYFRDGKPLAKFPILDLTYDTEYSKGLKNSDYLLGPAELNLEAESEYVIFSSKKDISIRFPLSKENNWGLQYPIEEILERSGVPNHKEYTGLFAPGCLPKQEIINKFSNIGDISNVSVSKKDLSDNSLIGSKIFRFSVEKER